MWTTQTIVIVAASLFTGLISLSMMFLVLWQAPNRRSNQLLATMMAALSAFSFFNVAARFSDDLGLNPANAFELSSVLYAWVITLFYVFGEAFTQHRNRYLQVFSLAFVAIFTASVALGLAFNPPQPSNTDIGGYTYSYKPIGLISNLLGIVYLTLIAYRLRTNPDPRSQTLWRAAAVIMLGISLLFARPLSQNVDNKILGLILTLPYNSIALGIAALMLGQAVMRYQLFDPLRHLNQQLQQTNRELEAAIRAKDQFLANMSHELRTPLNAIIGYITLVHDGIYGPVTDKQAERLERAERNAKHLLHLINMVLDLSKIRSGEFTLYPKAIEAKGVLDEVVDAVASLAEAKSLRLHADCLETIPFSADPERLKQVLINITSNAIKFTEQGSVSLRAYRQEGGVCFAVQDTGIGIAPEHQSQIFEEFKQADESTTRPYEGTGLGLAISKRLVELHGGSIGVESAIGQGSTFIIKLPMGE